MSIFEYGFDTHKDAHFFSKFNAQFYSVQSIIDALYQDSGYCYNIKELLKEKYEEVINEDEMFRLHKNAVDLEYAKEGNTVAGPHLCIKLSPKGRELILEYESYEGFLNSKNKEKAEKAQANKLNKHTIIIKNVHIIFTVFISLVTFALYIYVLLQNNKITELENLLKRNNIEISVSKK